MACSAASAELAALSNRRSVRISRGKARRIASPSHYSLISTAPTPRTPRPCPVSGCTLDRLPADSARTLIGKVSPIRVITSSLQRRSRKLTQSTRRCPARGAWFGTGCGRATGTESNRATPNMLCTTVTDSAQQPGLARPALVSRGLPSTLRHPTRRRQTSTR